MVNITTKEIPHSYRNKYLRSSGNTIVVSSTLPIEGGSIDTSMLAKLNAPNTFSFDNTFKAAVTIDNAAPSLVLKMDSVQVASLRYNTANARVELTNAKSNKALMLHDDGRFEFDESKILTAKNYESELNNTYVTLNTVQTIKGVKTFDASIVLTPSANLQSDGNIIHRKGNVDAVMWDSENSNKADVNWTANVLSVNTQVITNSICSKVNPNNGRAGGLILESIADINNNIVKVGNQNDALELTSFMNLFHYKNGKRFIIWDSDNSNLAYIDWTAKDLNAANNIQTINFASGWVGSGCRISSNGKAECSDLFVRGSLNVYELVVNQIRGTNGSLAVSDTGKVASVSGSIITLTGDNGNMNTFRIGDVLKCQSFTGKTVKLYQLTVTAISGLTVTFTYKSGGSGVNVVVPNDVLIRWNSSDANRKGLLYLTASDSESPYMDVVYDEQSRVRLGRLDGIAGLSGYGIVGRDSALNNIFHISSNDTANIAGWAFDRWTLRGGNIEMWSEGVIMHKQGKYSFNNDGGGQLASNNIRWDAEGNVTFGANVSLNWSSGITEAKNTANSANSTANNTVNALGGSSYPKLTKIDANGIYTGTLTAVQVNAVGINAGSITTGTLNADRIDANSLHGNKIIAGTISADKIASRSITADKIAAKSLTANEINVDTLTVSKLDGATGSFKSLTCKDNNGNIVGTMSFDGSGRLWFDGDMYHQGTRNGRSLRYYMSDVWVRGSFGAVGRTVMKITGAGSAYYYPNGLNSAGVYVSLARKTSTNGEVYYEIPLYSTDGDSSGMPVDVLLFDTSSGYNYVLDMAVTQRCLLANINNNIGVYIFANGRKELFNGGCTTEVICLKGHLKPSISSNILGYGILFGAWHDNNW